MSTFWEHHREEFSALARYYRSALLDEALPFWEERLRDREQGGFFTCYDGEGFLYKKVKTGWFAGRITWMYAALYRKVAPAAEWLDIAREGAALLTGPFFDGEQHFYSCLDRDFSRLEGAESIYTDHYAFLGLCEYVKASGDRTKLELIRRLFSSLLENIGRDQYAFDDQSGLRPLSIEFMTLLAAMEARELLGQAARLPIHRHLHNILHCFVDKERGHPLEYTDSDYRPRYEGHGRLMDPGHSLEALGFALEWAGRAGDDRMARRAACLVDNVMRLGWDTRHGGVLHLVDLFQQEPAPELREVPFADVQVNWDDKVWWVQAEALYTLALSALSTGNETQFAQFLELHRYCRERFRTNLGEWVSLLHRDGRVKDPRLGFELKGPYHIPRAYLNLMLLFQGYAQW